MGCRSGGGKFCAVLLVLLILVGCRAKTDGPERYELTGTVTYLGKPVSTGTIMFEPDFEKGNSGPGSYAVIQNGSYRTEPDKGIVGGPYLARIQGYDGVSYSDAEGVHEAGRPLFQEQTIYFDAPQENSTQDLVVEIAGQKK